MQNVKSGTDSVLPKIIGSGRVSGTRQALFTRGSGNLTWSSQTGFALHTDFVIIHIRQDGCDRICTPMHICAYIIRICQYVSPYSSLARLLSDQPLSPQK